MPISRQQALDYFHSTDLIGLGFEADAVRRRLHPDAVNPGAVVLDTNLDFVSILPGKGDGDRPAFRLTRSSARFSRLNPVPHAVPYEVNQRVLSLA